MKKTKNSIRMTNVIVAVAEIQVVRKSYRKEWLERIQILFSKAGKLPQTG